MTSSTTLTITQDQVVTVTFQFNDAEGAPFDLTGYAVSFSVRKNATALPVVVKSTSSHTDAPAGQTSIALDAQDVAIDTRVWKYSVSLTNGVGVTQMSALYSLVVTDNPTTPQTSVSVTIGNEVAIGVSLAGAPGAAGPGVAAGGASGQVLAKASNSDFDTVWIDGFDPSSLAAVATSGSYDDLTDKPSIPVTSVAGRTGAITLTKTDVALANVDNTSDASKPVSTAQQSALNAKAPLASPALTGTPTAPTATAGTNTTQIATTAFVTSAAPTAASFTSIGLVKQREFNLLDYGCIGDGTTDDSAAIQSLINTITALPGGGVISVPSNRYFGISSTVTLKSFVSIRGSGRGCGFKGNGSNLCMFKGANTSGSPVTDATFQDFDVDGSAVTFSSYATAYKGFFVQYMQRCQFVNVYVHDTVATAFGCDFLQDCVFDRCMAKGFGRGWTGSGFGANGIGIGTGGYTYENTIVTNCHADGNGGGNNGFDYELQNASPQSANMQFIGCTATGTKSGFRVSGAAKVSLTACHGYANSQNGLQIDTSPITGTTQPFDVSVLGGSFNDNTKSGIRTNNTATSQGPIKAIKFVGVTVTGNGITGEHGMWFTNIANFEVIGCEIYSNGQYGIYAQCTTSNAPMRNVTVLSNHIYNNSTQFPSNTDAIRLEQTSSGSINNVLVAHNHLYDDQGTPTQRYGLSLSTATAGSEIQVTNNYFAGNVTAPYAASALLMGVSIRNNIGLNPEVVYVQGSVTGATTFNRINGSYITATLTGGITATLTAGIAKGDTLTLELTQDATGGRAATWPVNFKRAGGALGLSTGANAVDVIDLRWNGASWYEVSRSLAVA
jgi:hypothetical protein